MESSQNGFSGVGKEVLEAAGALLRRTCQTLNTAFAFTERPNARMQGCFCFFGNPRFVIHPKQSVDLLPNLKPTPNPKTNPETNPSQTPIKRFISFLLVSPGTRFRWVALGAFSVCAAPSAGRPIAALLGSAYPRKNTTQCNQVKVGAFFGCSLDYFPGELPWDDC